MKHLYCQQPPLILVVLQMSPKTSKTTFSSVFRFNNPAIQIRNYHPGNPDNSIPSITPPIESARVQDFFIVVVLEKEETSICAVKRNKITG